MSFKIIQTTEFEKEAKRLSKKYPSLKHDLGELFDSLETNPVQGTSLGNNCFKVRLAIASKGKGKSGGARIITCFFIMDEEVLLLGIYDKSEQSTITDEEIKIHLKPFAK